jgi:hypothetical protein
VVFSCNYGLLATTAKLAATKCVDGSRVVEDLGMLSKNDLKDLNMTTGDAGRLLKALESPRQQARFNTTPG